MKELRETIASLIAPVLEGRGAFLIDVVLKSERRDKVILVLADTDEGITIDQCAELSRGIGEALEGARVPEGPYRLEVSSPGIDRPLRLLRQYRKNIGRHYRLRYRSGEQEHELQGTLAGVEGSRVTITQEHSEAVTVAYEDILECKEILPW